MEVEEEKGEEEVEVDDVEGSEKKLCDFMKSKKRGERKIDTNARLQWLHSCWKKDKKRKKKRRKKRKRKKGEEEEEVEEN